MADIHDPHFAAVFGLLGNILSFFVYLAPLPTFCKIFKRKSTEGFQSIPYSVALFSAMLLLYYAFLKTNALMLITINSIGCVIESTYLILFMIYATRSARIYTTKLLLLFNLGTIGLIIILTFIFSKGSQRITIVGWICAVFSVCVYAAPLSIMRLVIRSKSVKYMPFSLSFFLTLCAITWFLYGFSLRDYYISTPNILGFTFGVTQMILYTIYSLRKKETSPETKPQEQTTNSIQMSSNVEQPPLEMAVVSMGIGNTQVVPDSAELNV
ncbi:hypothetical protein SLE2022_244030 [Rubroshorea leprosula]